MQTWLGGITIAWMLAHTLLLLAYRHALAARWREPVLRYPVLIIESDDWGAGPVQAQAIALNQILNALSKYKDTTGRHPLITLALVLATPDGTTIRNTGRYTRILLNDHALSPVLEIIIRGQAAGIFSLQLHGMEHFWPDTLISSTDPAVHAWLRDESPSATESLPSFLQSRWIDASTLPSRHHPAHKIEAAVAEETDLFQHLFGQRTLVVVPPTFVWTKEVEQAWARHGIQFVVTPGRRYTCRDAEGNPGCVEGPLWNAMAGAGVSYLVRDDYFEPERGHTAEHALLALERKWSQGRPCLLETHRANFIGDVAVAQQSIAEIERLYTEALSRFPSLRFVSCEELGVALRERDPAWVESRLGIRISTWVARVRTLPRFWRLARLTGLAWLMVGGAQTMRAMVR